VFDAFAELCDGLEVLLAGAARRDLAERVSHGRTFADACARLEPHIAAHSLPVGRTTLRLKAAVAALDALTKTEGFNVLNDWDGPAVRISTTTIPVDVLRFLGAARAAQPADPCVLAVLIDYYVMHVLALLTLRVWDAGDPNANLDRVSALLAQLQGPNGSGHRFAEDPETLLLIGTSHYEPEDHGYERYLQRVPLLNAAHQHALAMCHAASLGAHLRFGFEAPYVRNVRLMREDNIVDYPWLAYGLRTLLRELDDERDEDRRARTLEAICCGLTGDAPALLAQPDIAAGVARHRGALMAALTAMRPTQERYAPLALFFNFAFNVVKGAVVDAMLWGAPRAVSLNDFFTGIIPDDSASPSSAARTGLAVTLMNYARQHPDRIRGQLLPVIVYEPATGRRALADALRALQN